jgi:outer membrane protein TolC
MKSAFSLVLLLVAVNLNAQNPVATTEFSLSQAIEYAVKNGYSVKNAATDVEIAEKKVKEVRGIGLPQMRAEAGFQDFLKVPVSLLKANSFNPNASPDDYLRLPFGVKYNMSYGYTASWLLFSGEYIMALRSSKTYTDISQTMLRKTEIELKESVTRAYYSVLILKESRKILTENIASIEKSINETSAYNKEGFVEEQDVDRLKLVKSSQNIMLNSLNNQYELAEKMLKFEMGYDVSAPIVLSESFEQIIKTNSEGVDVQPKFDYSNNIENIMIQKSYNFQKLNIKVLKANYIPTLSTFYSWKESRITDDFDQLTNTNFRVPGGTIFGLNLSVPIFQGFGQQAKIQQAKLGLTKIELQQKQIQEGLLIQSAQALNEYTTALDSYKNAKEASDLSIKIRDRSKIKYNEGVGSSIEVIQIENEVLNAQSNYVNAAMKLLNARVTLDKVLNKF